MKDEWIRFPLWVLVCFGIPLLIAILLYFSYMQGLVKAQQQNIYLLDKKNAEMQVALLNCSEGWPITIYVTKYDIVSVDCHPIYPERKKR